MLKRIEPTAAIANYSPSLDLYTSEGISPVITSNNCFLLYRLFWSDRLFHENDESLSIFE